MSNVENPGAGDPDVGPLLGGANQPIHSQASVKFSTDAGQVRKLTDEFKSLNNVLKEAVKNMVALGKASSRVQGPGGTGTTAGTGAAGTTMSGGIFGTFFDKQGGTGATPSVTPVLGAAGGGRMAAVAGAVGAAGTVINAGFAAMDARADRGRDYALSADRMSLVYQQMYGMTQNQVSAQYRTPMAQFKLGEGGINAMMGMQVSTGISAMQQASSVEAMRAMTGFSISAGQATSMISQLAAPDVANRMFMMGGTGLIGPGGQQRSTMQVMQDITRSAGLTDPRLAKSALAPGSVTRANLAMMGVTGEMQDMVIQYAQQNIQYRQRGGRGMYDPSSKEAQKIMGIEDNFAMQAEETDRTRIAREEQFYRRHADNYADLEKQTQSLTRAMGKLEDALSGIIGQSISTRGARGVGSVAGTLLGGAVGAFFGGPAGAMAGAALGSAAGNLVGGMIGDPVDGEKTVPFGKADTRIPLSQLSTKSTFSKLHPTFQERLQRMFEANPAVGIGGGYRDPSSQETLFRSRHTPTDKVTNIYWDGQYWEHTSGPPAAPPGKSMHEIGLAADLVGDLDWVQKNAARFGLKTFAGVNGEPWHVQPAELPNSRSEYEKNGAPWGTMGAPSSANTRSPVGEHEGSTTDSGAPVSSGGALAGYSSQLSIAEHLAATRGFVLGKRTPGKSGPASNKDKGTATPTNTGSGGGIGGEAVARYLYAAGFRGQDLIDAVAIAWRESRWNPSSVARDSDDESYGLMQINMHPELTSPEENRKAWGIPNNEALLDPATNARIAFEKYKWRKSHGHDPFRDWYHGGNHLGETSDIYAEATRIVQGMDNFTGDPMPVSGGPSAPSMRQSTTVSGNHTFNISPNITINGSANNADLQQIARAVSRLIEQELRTTALRSY
jgi:hypothetical protein